MIVESQGTALRQLRDGATRRHAGVLRDRF